MLESAQERHFTVKNAMEGDFADVARGLSGVNGGYVGRFGGDLGCLCAVLAGIAPENGFLSSWEVPERARERHFTVKTCCAGRFSRFRFVCLFSIDFALGCG